MAIVAERAHRARPEDTSPEAWRILIDIWRSKTPLEKLAMCQSMSVEILQMAESGIRTSVGDVTPERMRWLLTERRYGTPITEEAFGSEPPK